MIVRCSNASATRISWISIKSKLSSLLLPCIFKLYLTLENMLERDCDYTSLNNFAEVKVLEKIFFLHNRCYWPRVLKVMITLKRIENGNMFAPYYMKLKHNWQNLIINRVHLCSTLRGLQIFWCYVGLIYYSPWHIGVTPTTRVSLVASTSPLKASTVKAITVSILFSWKTFLWNVLPPTYIWNPRPAFPKESLLSCKTLLWRKFY